MMRQLSSALVPAVLMLGLLATSAFAEGRRAAGSRTGELLVPRGGRSGDFRSLHELLAVKLSSTMSPPRSQGCQR